MFFWWCFNAIQCVRIRNCAISASIIIQLLTVVSPLSFSELRKEGESGQRKINKYTRYGTLILASFKEPWVFQRC